MKKVNRIFVALSMLCMVISITAICFSFAWYAVYPVYHNISLNTGNEALLVESEVYVRGRDAQDNSVFSAAENVKSVEKVGDTIIHKQDGTEVKYANGKLNVDFTGTPLIFDIFGTNATEITSNGLLDPTTGNWKCEYLTFALIECRFYNQLFPAYAKAKYTANITWTGNTGAGLENLFQIRTYVDKTLQGQNTKIISDPNAATPDTNLSNLLDNYSTIDGTTLVDLVNDGTGDAATRHPIFTDNTGAETMVEILPNTNTKGQAPNVETCYSYAFAMALSIDANVLFNNFKKIEKGTSAGIKLSLEFAASNVNPGATTTGF